MHHSWCVHCVYVINESSSGNDELDEIESAYANVESKSMVMVGFNRRFAPQVQKMKELMYETMVEMIGKDKADKKLKNHDIKLLNNEINELKGS